MTELDAGRMVARLRAGFNSGVTRDLAWRERQLDALIELLTECEGELLQALQADLGKPVPEAMLTDVMAGRGDAELARAELRRWSAPRAVEVPDLIGPAQAWIHPEPLGLVLILGTWNYPAQQAIAPLAGALAAGNAVLFKPSELAPASSRLFARELANRLDPSAFAVVEGGPEVASALLEQRFDHIFYTGSLRVGKIILSAAAKYLTPVTLELGGKCPAYVDDSADVGAAARRIAWIKFLNAGQTCLSPDYVLVHQDKKAEFVDGLREAITTSFGDNPKSSPNFGRIINDHHVARLEALRDGHGAGQPVIGGRSDATQRFIEPTVLVGTEPASAIMQEEIFGPLLPVIMVRGIDEAIEFTTDRPKPLASYVFAEDEDVVAGWLDRVSSGGVCVNAAILHAVPPDLPFGGVGDSGFGVYHGRHTFDTFSHLKSVLRKPPNDDLSYLMPPYATENTAADNHA